MAYNRRGWRFWVPTIASTLGTLVGLAILICFLTAYNNFHVAVWGGTSGVLSGLTLVMHLAVRWDKELKLDPDRFTALMVVGVFGFMSGFGAIIGYLVKGIMQRETGIHVEGSFIVTVWSFMTFKWGIFLFYHAKTYKRELLRERPMLLNTIQT